METISSFLHEVRKKYLPVIIITHVNADPDAIASAFLLKYFFDLHSIRNYILFPGISRLSKEILLKLGIKTNENYKKYNDVFYAIVDTSNSILLDKYGNIVLSKLDKVLVIDHHFPFGDLKEAKYKKLEKETATTVLVVDIFKKFNLPLNPLFSTLALTGLIYDTQRFRFMSTRTAEILLYLLKNGGIYEKALNMLQSNPLEYSEKIARIKGARRADIIKIKKYIIAITYVSSYEASVANALINLGVDLAIVIAAKKRDELRISARASKSFVKETGLRVGEDLMKNLEHYLDGSGGGHDTAGGFNGKGELSSALRIIEKLIFEKIGRL